MIKKLLVVIAIASNLAVFAQHEEHHAAAQQNMNSQIEPQPLLAQAIRLKDALSFLGSSLTKDDVKQLASLQHQPLTQETSKRVQEILDPYCIAIININPESRVKVLRGTAKPRLMQDGWVSYLVRVNNDAGVTSQL